MLRKKIRAITSQGREGQRVEVLGWVRSKRVSKKVAFIMISDGSCQHPLQVIVDAENGSDKVLKMLQTGCSVRVEGTLKASQGKGQEWEVMAEDLRVFGEAPTHNYPLQKKGHSLEFLREIAHLRPRTNTFGAVFRVRNTLAYAVHRFFQERSFIWAQTPILTASDCEGAGEMFTVTALDLESPSSMSKKPSGEVDFAQDLFGKKAHLTVSGQLQAEFLALSMGDVYTFGPTFRAENSNTSRHLCEFWMVEPEMAFADLNVCMDVAEEFIRYLVQQVVEQCSEELEFFEKFYKRTSIKMLEKLSILPVERISYSKAVEVLESSGAQFEYPVSWGLDLQTEHERFLCEEVCKSPVCVYDYPQSIKPFYMRQNDHSPTVAAVDLLVPGVGELIGGSQREDRLDYLEKSMDNLGISKEDLQWYLDLRRFGSVPHSGFGMGFERLIMYITGMQNIRDTIMCPRSPKQIGF